METVTLKNGTEEAKPLVAVMMLTLEHLFEEDPIAAYELVMLCRNKDHVLFGNTGATLKDLSLVERDGRVCQSIRNVVLSAVVGDGLDMILQSPV